MPDDYSAAERDLILEQFGGVTPENCMKMTAPPAAGRANSTSNRPTPWSPSPSEHQLQVCGHTLVWAKDERTPAWVFLDGDKPASRELVLRRMRTHIRAVVGAVSRQGRVVGRGQRGPRRRRAVPPRLELAKLAGPEFVAGAFEWAHEADPDALLALQRLQRRTARQAREARSA